MNLKNGNTAAMMTLMRLPPFLPIIMLPFFINTAVASTHEECIKEPVFKGRVCTLQANRDAAFGVILIHGLGGSTDDWKNTLPALAGNFHVVTFDLPGFGKSDKGSKSYSPTRYAQLVQHLADRYLPDKPYHVVGHSMGGAIALRYAAQRPSRFQRLVLIDAAGILHPQVITTYQAGSMMERASGIQQTRGFAERFSGKILEQVDRLPISPFDIVGTALGREHVLQGGPEKIAALELAGEDFGRAITTVNEPTLILWGKQDPIAPLRTGRVLAANMRNAHLIIIDDAGHEPMQDQRERTNTLLTSFLAASNHEVAKFFTRQDALPPLSSERTGKCSGESGKVFEGDYRSIELKDCSNITIRNARVGRLSVLNSRVNLIDTDIAGKEVGLQADNSEITITNGNISAATAIITTGSRFDIAGTHLKGTRATVKGVDSKLVLSVSQLDSPLMTGPVHDYKNMVDEEL